MRPTTRPLPNPVSVDVPSPNADSADSAASAAKLQIPSVPRYPSSRKAERSAATVFDAMRLNIRKQLLHLRRVGQNAVQFDTAHQYDLALEAYTEVVRELNDVLVTACQLDRSQHHGFERPSRKPPKTLSSLQESARILDSPYENQQTQRIPASLTESASNAKPYKQMVSRKPVNKPLALQLSPEPPDDSKPSPTQLSPQKPFIGSSQKPPELVSIQDRMAIMAIRDSYFSRVSAIADVIPQYITSPAFHPILYVSPPSNALIAPPPPTLNPLPFEVTFMNIMRCDLSKVPFDEHGVVAKFSGELNTLHSDYWLRPLDVMKKLIGTMRRGGLLTPNLYVPYEVWRQPGIQLIHAMDTKMQLFSKLLPMLVHLEQYQSSDPDVKDLDRFDAVLTDFEKMIEPLRTQATKRLKIHTSTKEEHYTSDEDGGEAGKQVAGSPKFRALQRLHLTTSSTSSAGETDRSVMATAMQPTASKMALPHFASGSNILPGGAAASSLGIVGREKLKSWGGKIQRTLEKMNARASQGVANYKKTFVDSRKDKNGHQMEGFRSNSMITNIGDNYASNQKTELGDTAGYDSQQASERTFQNAESHSSKDPSMSSYVNLVMEVCLRSRQILLVWITLLNSAPLQSTFPTDIHDHAKPVPVEPQIIQEDTTFKRDSDSLYPPPQPLMRSASPSTSPLPTIEPMEHSTQYKYHHIRSRLKKIMTFFNEVVCSIILNDLERLIMRFTKKIRKIATI